MRNEAGSKGVTRPSGAAWIPEPLGPIERGEKYANPLSDALGEFGEVTGGGSQLGEDGTIAFCGLDVVVNHRENGLKAIRQCL